MPIRPKPEIHESEGMQLKLSTRTNTGYAGVSYDQSRGKNPYRMVVGKTRGRYASAVQAAVAYAKYAESPEIWHKWDQEREAAELAESAHGKNPEIVTEVDGMTLHLSAASKTGYLGVYHKPMGGRGHINKLPYVAHGPRQPDGKPGQHLGFFGTALEGAIAYAKFVAPEGDFTLPERKVRKEKEDKEDNGGRAKKQKVAHRLAPPPSTPGSQSEDGGSGGASALELLLGAAHAMDHEA